jgi:peptide chain release factor 1
VLVSPIAYGSGMEQMETVINSLKTRYSALVARTADPALASDAQQLAQVGRELHKLEPLIELAHNWQRAASDIAGAEELLAEGMPEARAMRDQARVERDAFAEQLRLGLIEPNPNDERNVIIEVRAGAGGQEAALFAQEIFAMLLAYADRRGFTLELLTSGEAFMAASIAGSGAFSVFKYEAGTHRVQRVPATETQGRIHTSTATVAVLAEADDVEIVLNPAQIKVDTFRATGAGGQHINKTDSAIRMTHLPTGVVVEMQDERSQAQNRERALRVLRARLVAREEAVAQATQAAARREQVGGGDRSEKIRTYNFPQDRLTDHRIGWSQGHVIETLKTGALDELTAALQTDERRRRLDAQTEATHSRLNV